MIYIKYKIINRYTGCRYVIINYTSKNNLWENYLKNNYNEIYKKK